MLRALFTTWQAFHLHTFKSLHESMLAERNHQIWIEQPVMMSYLSQSIFQQCEFWNSACLFETHFTCFLSTPRNAGRLDQPRRSASSARLFSFVRVLEVQDLPHTAAAHLQFCRHNPPVLATNIKNACTLETSESLLHDAKPPTKLPVPPGPGRPSSASLNRCGCRKKELWAPESARAVQA